MNILFIRHGESFDDLTDQLGGWGDFDLTPNGRKQIQESSRKISELNINFQSIISSPLKRAEQTAQIISKTLNVSYDIDVYLKEKNGYGLISGMNKNEVKEKYPELYDLINPSKDSYIFGSEPQDKFVERVEFALEKIKTLEENTIVVSHGGFVSTLLQDLLKIDVKNIGDGGFIVMNFDKDKFEIIAADGIGLRS